MEINDFVETKLPTPRFEFVWEKEGDDWFKSICTYNLVLPFRDCDCRRETEDGMLQENVIELGVTKVTGGTGEPPIYMGTNVETPYRDGSHARWDCHALGGDIPIFAICEGTVCTVDKDTGETDLWTG